MVSQTKLAAIKVNYAESSISLYFLQTIELVDAGIGASFEKASFESLLINILTKTEIYAFSLVKVKMRSSAKMRACLVFKQRGLLTSFLTQAFVYVMIFPTNHRRKKDLIIHFALRK